jgi:hypothetical protein
MGGGKVTNSDFGAGGHSLNITAVFVGKGTGTIVREAKDRSRNKSADLHVITTSCPTTDNRDLGRWLSACR